MFSKSYSEHRMRIRNLSLRFLISCKYKLYKTKVLELKNNLLQTIQQTYDKSIFIYNDYNQLNDDNKLFIETILGLIF
jgi:hypothetical protein